MGGQEDVRGCGKQPAACPVTRGPLRRLLSQTQAPAPPEEGGASQAHQGHHLLTSVREPGCPPSRLLRRDPEGRLQGRGDPGGRTAHTLPRALRHPQPRSPLAARVGQEEGLGMVGRRFQAGCLTPRPGAPCSLSVPTWCPRVECWLPQSLSTCLPLPLSVSTVSTCPLTPSARLASLPPCLSLHLLLVTSALPPSSSESFSLSPPLLSPCISLWLTLSLPHLIPPHSRGLPPWTFLGESSTKAHS